MNGNGNLNGRMRRVEDALKDIPILIPRPVVAKRIKELLSDYAAGMLTGQRAADAHRIIEILDECARRRKDGKSNGYIA